MERVKLSDVVFPDGRRHLPQTAERLAGLWGSLPACSVLPAGEGELILVGN